MRADLKKHPIRRVFIILLLLAAIAGGVRMWSYINEQVQPILVPLNQAYAGYSNVPKKVPGLRLEEFSFTGWDNGEIRAVLAEKDGEESSRQLSVVGALTHRPATRLSYIDYVLVCVDWDHGIRSALPLAETLTAAGLRCVLWDPRGKDDRRPYCTHGLKECFDVPQLVNELVRRSGKENPVIVAVGQGYGAGLLLQAAAWEPRIRSIISIDAYASLRQAVRRIMPDSLLTPVLMGIMDMRINRMAGIECFDVAPVDRAAAIDRNVPVLVVNLARQNPVCTPKDALLIYKQLRSDIREIWTMPPADAEIVREIEEDAIPVRYLTDEDSSLTDMIYWLNDTVVEALQSPRVRVPARPVPSTDLLL